MTVSLAKPSANSGDAKGDTYSSIENVTGTGYGDSITGNTGANTLYGVGGNDARFINHQCDPNCESTIEKGRVFIDAIRSIAKGEELGYDYQIGREKGDPPNVDEIYACRCGSPKCRGTMLWPPKRPSPRKRKKKTARRTRSKRKK